MADFSSLASYILFSLAFYQMFKKAGNPQPWLAWIPVGQLVPLLRIIGRRPIELLWILVPVVNIVFSIMWYAELFKSFGKSPHILWWYLFPIVGWIVIDVYILMIGLSSNIEYVGPAHQMNGGYGDSDDYSGYGSGY